MTEKSAEGMQPKDEFKVQPKFYDQEIEGDLEKPGIDRRTLLAGLAGFSLGGLSRVAGEYAAEKAERAKRDILTKETLETIDDYSQAIIDMALAEARVVAKNKGVEPGLYALAVLQEFERKFGEKMKDPKSGDKVFKLNTDYLNKDNPGAIPIPERKRDGIPGQEEKPEFY